MLKKLTDRVYYMDFVQQGDRPVLGLVIGDKYSMVIDGGNSKAHAEEFLRGVKELNVTNLKYLVLTHWHWDHVFGMKTMNLINIVSKKSNEKIEWMRTLKWTDEAIRERVISGEEIEFCEEHIKIEHPNNNREVEIADIDIVFENEIEIDLGGVLVKMEQVNCDHSEDSSLVNVVSEGVTFMGDAMYLDMYNGPWSYSREKLYPFLDKLKGYNSKFYVPAHHPLYSNEGFGGFIKHITEVGDAVDNLQDIEKAKEEVKKVKGCELSKWDIEDTCGFVEGNKKSK